MSPMRVEQVPLKSCLNNQIESGVAVLMLVREAYSA